MASPLRWTDENGGVPSRPQHLRYPYPAKRPTDALGESKYSKLEPRNPGSALVKWFTHLFKRSSRVNFALLAHRYNLLVPMHFFCLIVTFDRSISKESNSKGLFKETEKKNWNVTTKPMCKLYWIASAPARKPYRIGYELWFWRVFCDEAPRRSLKGRVTYIGKKFILKRIDFRAASKWMWIEFAHVQLYANLQGSVTIYGIS